MDARQSGTFGRAKLFSSVKWESRVGDTRRKSPYHDENVRTPVLRIEDNGLDYIEQFLLMERAVDAVLEGVCLPDELCGCGHGVIFELGHGHILTGYLRGLSVEKGGGCLPGCRQY